MSKLKLFLGVCLVAGAAQLLLILPSRADFFQAHPFISRGLYHQPQIGPVYWNSTPFPVYNFGYGNNPYSPYNPGYSTPSPYPAFNGYGNTNVYPPTNYVIPYNQLWNPSGYPYSPAFNPSLYVPYSVPSGSISVAP